jgi:plastocyanin
MRPWVAALIAVTFAGGLALTADAAVVHVIKVNNGEFSPSTLTISKDDVVRWELETGAGTQVLASGEGPDDILAGVEWDNLVVSGQPTPVERTFDRVGVFKYFSRSRPSLKGTITVTSGPAPIDAKTWGYLKKMFEGAARPRR